MTLKWPEAMRTSGAGYNRDYYSSCGGGNLVPIVVRMRGKLVPHVAMVSKRLILRGEELSFMYGLAKAEPSSPAGSSPSKAATEARARPRPCYCQSPACTGLLPSNDAD